MITSLQGEVPQKRSPFTYQTTYARGAALVALLRRDAAMLAARGINAARIDALENLIEIAKTLPVSEHYEMVVSAKALAKNAARNEVKYLLEEVRGMVENVYGAASDMYRQFGFVNLFNLSDNDFAGVVRGKLMPALTLHAAELAPEGYSEAMMTELRDKMEALAAAFAAVGTARGNARAATSARITSINEIWEELSAMATTGKIYFRRRNAGAYTEYCAITARNNSAAPKPDLPLHATSDLSAEAISQADKAAEINYTIEIIENKLEAEHNAPENTGAIAEANNKTPANSGGARAERRRRTPVKRNRSIFRKPMPAKLAASPFVHASAIVFSPAPSEVYAGLTAAEAGHLTDRPPSGRIGHLTKRHYPRAQ